MKSIKRNQPSSKLRKHQLEILTNREAHCGVQFLNQTREIWAFFLHLSTALLCSPWNWNWWDSECTPGRNHKQAGAFGIISEQMKANIILIAFHFALQGALHYYPWLGILIVKLPQICQTLNFCLVSEYSFTPWRLTQVSLAKEFFEANYFLIACLHLHASRDDRTLNR